MGRTSKPVLIAVSPQVAAWEETKALVEQGHQIEVVLELARYDLVLSENAWNMDDSLRSYLLSHAIPAARKRAAERKKIAE